MLRVQRFSGRGGALCGVVLCLLLLSACTGLPPASIEQISDDKGNTELILEAVDVWDDEGAAEPGEFTVGGREMTFRVRPTDPFAAPAWVRLGLFWHSKQKRVYMPIVIAGGPPVTIRKVRLEAGQSYAELQPAKDFKFTPGKRTFDKDLHSATFTMSPEMLAQVGKADNSYVTISTERGALRVNLAVAVGSDSDALEATAKYQFSKFHRRWKRQQ